MTAEGMSALILSSFAYAPLTPSGQEDTSRTCPASDALEDCTVPLKCSGLLLFWLPVLMPLDFING